MSRRAAGHGSMLAASQVVVVGPAPPLRGGIAAHSAGLVEYLRAQGVVASVASYRRLYPSLGFPGRSQRSAAPHPPWSDEILDVLGPRSWARLRRHLEASQATVVLQWWHPVVAPALLGATRGLARERLVAVCHNALPHERLPGAAVAARRALGRCGRVLCHSAAEAAVVERLLGARAGEIVQTPLPCLVATADLGRATCPAEVAAMGGDARFVVAAGHLRAYKGTAVLLRAWARARRPAAARLLLVGESYLRGRGRREVAALVGNDPSIVLVDRYVEDAELVSFVAFAEALVAPYLSASQSGMIAIARALGVPCIVSDAGGLAEQAAAGAPAGDCQVVKAGDVGALAAALEGRFALAPRRPHALAIERRGDGQRILDDWQRVAEAMGIGRRP